MSLRLSEILEYDAPHLFLTSRKALQGFYDALVQALRQDQLTPEGGAVPTTLNTLLALLPGDLAPAARDRELTDWSVENDAKYAAFLERWRALAAAQQRPAAKPRAVAAPLHQAVTRLESLQGGSTKKAELEQAVVDFLDVYALSQHSLRLPHIDRELPRKLPVGITLDEEKVTLGKDTGGQYVGLVKVASVRSEAEADTAST